LTVFVRAEYVSATHSLGTGDRPSDHTVVSAEEENMARAKRKLKRIPATPRNLERDHRNKVALSRDFRDFKRRVEEKIKKHRECRDLLIHLRRVYVKVRRVAYGVGFDPLDKP
jgi:hypothetical protein